MTPHTTESCLNNRCTETIVQIYDLLQEAEEKFISLPDCLKNVQTEHSRNTGENLHWYLLNTKNSVHCFAKEFGIEVE